jgi:hypothetical protein
MTDAKDRLQFLQRGVGVMADVHLKFGRIELAPVAPTGLGCQRVRFGGGQVTIDGAFAQPKQPGGLGPRAARLHKLHHPLAQIQRVGFHALSLSLILPMSMVNAIFRPAEVALEKILQPALAVFR